jgi:hypothetical protein
VKRAQAVGLVVFAAALSGCTVDTASLDDARTVTAPSFAPLPASPIESPQLDAIVERDTAGVVNTEPDADPTLIGRALEALLAAFPGTTMVGDIYVTHGAAYITIPDPDVAGRTITTYFNGQALSAGEPEFNSSTGLFPIERVRPDVIVALVQGLIERYPTMQVELPRLDVSLSYSLGLSWRIELNDARGALATIWADLDGRVTAVDVETD